MNRLSANFRVLMLACVLTTLSFFAGCSEDPITTNIQQNSTVSNSPAGPTDLTLDSVKILIKQVNFEMTIGSRTGNVNRPSHEIFAPVGVRLNLASSVNILNDWLVPSGTFNKITYTIEKSPIEVRPPDPDFYFNDDIYCIVAFGHYNRQPFVFRSRRPAYHVVSFHQPVEYTSQQRVNLPMKVKPLDWFWTGREFLDPSNPANQDIIEDMIAISLLKNDETGAK